MKHVISILLVLWTCIAMGQETGPAGSVLRVPSGGGKATMGPLDLSSSNATTNYLGISKLNGLTTGACLFGGATGFILQDATNCFWDATANGLAIGASSLNASAKFQVDSTTRGALIPRMTTTQRDAIASPANGLLIYNTTLNQLQSYNSSTSMWGAAGRLQGDATALNASAAFQVDSTTRGSLSTPRMTATQRDAIASPATGLQIYNTDTNQLNVYNGSAWVAVGSGGSGGGGINLLALNGGNYDAEQGTNGWTASGGTFTTSTSNPYEGLRSFTWDASALSQTLDSPAVSILNSFIGRKCQIHIPYYSYTGSANDLQVQVIDGSANVLVSQVLPITTGSNTASFFQTFDCPSSVTTMKARLLANVANPSLVKFDVVFLGQGRNEVQSSTANIVAALRLAPVTNCVITTTSGTVADVATDADCTAGLTAFGDAQIVSGDYRLRVPKLLPGRYEVIANWPLRSQGSAGTLCEGYISLAGGLTGGLDYVQNAQEGTNADDELDAVSMNGYFETASSVGQTDVYFSWRRVGGAGSCALNFASMGAPATITLKRYPLNPAEGNTYETSGWYFDGNIGGANVSLGTGAVTSFSAMNNATLDLVVNSGSQPGRISCNGVASTGTTCSGANEEVGVSVDIPYAGLYEACFGFSHSMQMAVNSSIGTTFQVVRTADPSSGIVEEGRGRIESARTTPSNITGTDVTDTPNHTCGLFNIPTAGRNIFKLMYEQSVGGSPSASLVVGDRLSTNGQRDIQVNIKPWTQQMPAPVFDEFKRKINSGSANQRVEWALINPNTTCTVLTSSSSWITSASAIGGAAGKCTLNYSGIWSAPPVCTLNHNAATTPTASHFFVLTAAPTTTSLSFMTGFYSGTINFGGYDTHIICAGPQ